MRNLSASIRRELRWILLFVASIWVAYLLTLALPALKSYGLVPRTLVGLIGIVSMTFLHADLFHLLGNTFPLLVLLTLLMSTRPRSWDLVAAIAVACGGLLWMCGMRGNHIGASGLIFGLVAFLLLSGILERRVIPLLISLLVGFMYGGTLLWGILPRFGSEISWDGHLCGVVAGAAAAYWTTRQPRSAGPGRRIPAAGPELLP